MEGKRLPHIRNTLDHRLMPMQQRYISNPRIFVCLLAVLSGSLLKESIVQAEYPLVYPGAQLEEVVSTSCYYEGPSWDQATGKLYFTRMTCGARILCLDPPATIYPWMSDTNGINGTFLSNSGRLLCAQGGSKKIISIGIGASGPTDIQELAHNSSWEAPNDICQADNGNIYFTTPDFGSLTNSGVHLLRPTGYVEQIITDMPVPNGVITSLDGKTLYVSDSHLRHWKSYPILEDGTVGSGSVFFSPSTSNTREPDGMSIDELGNLYFAGRGGIWIVSPGGAQLDMIPVPVFASNVTFGGSDGRELYVTGQDRVYRLKMEVRGANWRGVSEENQRPVVDAGGVEVLIPLKMHTTLHGSVSDDGKPTNPGAVTFSWSVVDGPGTVTFADTHSLQTAASFTEVGEYSVRLTAFDGERYAYDDLRVEIRRPGDLDGDRDIDDEDMAKMRPCLTGPDQAYDPDNLPNGCGAPPDGDGVLPVDFDQDGDVDLIDFGRFQRCLSGSGIPGEFGCASP
jgi:gluconolactonase